MPEAIVVQSESRAASRWRAHAVAAIAAALTGCAAVGPEYVRPELPVPDGWSRVSTRVEPDVAAGAASVSTTASASTASTAAPASTIAATSTIAPASMLWWRQFDDPVLGDYVEQALLGTPELRAGLAKLAAARVSLAAEVALAYVEVRAQQARIDVARRNLETQAETLQLTRWRAQAGLVGALDVEQARTSVEQTRAQIPVLESALGQARHRLAVLLGRPPAALDVALAAPAPIPSAPMRIALSIPAAVLAQRPDVAAAERALAAETARVGVAHAARYPSLSLGASIGLQALTPGGLLDAGATTRSLFASLAGTIFDAGRLRRQVDIRSAVQAQALAQYESTVLTALQEVENALLVLAVSGERQAALASAADAARNAALLARQRYASGLADFQAVLDSGRTVLTLDDALVSGRADSSDAMVRLYKALGGGWAAAPDNERNTP